MASWHGSLDLLRPYWQLLLQTCLICRSQLHMFPGNGRGQLYTPSPKYLLLLDLLTSDQFLSHPFLCRIFERIVVRQYIYPSLLCPPYLQRISDQFVFRPSGSTTAALISIFHTITSMLANNKCVIVYAVDFSKAFDTVRHSTQSTNMPILTHLTLSITGLSVSFETTLTVLHLIIRCQIPSTFRPA